MKTVVGIVVSAPFVRRAEGGSARQEKNRIPDGAVVIHISANGYEPSTVTVEEGHPVTLAFVRNGEPNCGREVIFPKLGIRDEVPVGGVTLVELPAGLHGVVPFSCGMGVCRGAVVIGEAAKGLGQQ